jgi:hypothetical protein
MFFIYQTCMLTYSIPRLINNKTVDFKREKDTIALIYGKYCQILFDKIIKVGFGQLLNVDVVPHQKELKHPY